MSQRGLRNRAVSSNDKSRSSTSTPTDRTRPSFNYLFVPSFLSLSLFFFPSLISIASNMQVRISASARRPRRATHERILGHADRGVSDGVVSYVALYAYTRGYEAHLGVNLPRLWNPWAHVRGLLRSCTHKGTQHTYGYTHRTRVERRMHSRRRGATRHDPPPGPGLVNVNASVSVLTHLTTRAPMTYGIRGDTHNTGAGHYQRPWLHCSGCITPGYADLSRREEK